MSNVGFTRRDFMRLASASVALSGFATAGVVHAEPQSGDARWIVNHLDTRLLSADGQAIAGLPKWTHMRVLRNYPTGFIQVWVPRFGLVGRVVANSVGPVPAPSQLDLRDEQLAGPPLLGRVGLPGRVVGGANLRTWPVVGNTVLRTLGHNAPLRVLDSVEGDDGDQWYRASVLDGASGSAAALGYVHNSLVRLPRLRYTPKSPDRA